jgi:RecJ-like exonuclease
MIEKTALSISVIGVFVLLVLSQFIAPPLVEISKINKKMIDALIAFNGEVENVKKTGEVCIITVSSLNNDSRIRVIAYDLKQIPHGEIYVEGKVTDYKGQIEVEAARIKSG